MGIEDNNSIENMEALRTQQEGLCGGTMGSHEIAALNLGFPPSNTAIISGKTASEPTPFERVSEHLQGEGGPQTKIALNKSFDSAVTQSSDASIAALITELSPDSMGGA